MSIVDLIVKKRDGQSLSNEDIRWFIQSYTDDNIADYQVSALLMAILLKGMSREETVNLTIAMAESGDMLDLSDIVSYAIDKHSSGGVGDKTTLVVLPVVSSFGVPIAKMSGRGLGFSGGTLDKLESINGFNVNLSESDFRRIAQETGLVLAGQTKSLAPADGKLYSLRDVTGTVESLPLIASSIMSKKLAAGANGIVLDVKLGHGAFMKTLDDARELATIMVGIGVDAGRDMVALLSDMNQPLGVAVGNALEVAEAVRTLQGHGPTDFHEHCVDVSAYMLKLAGQGEKWVDIDEARDAVETVLQEGQAFDRFRQMVTAQDGDASQVDDLSLLPRADIIETITAEQSGYIQNIFADKIGLASLALGAGRVRKEDSIDYAVGIEVHASVGDAVQAGDTIITVHANSQESLSSAKQLIHQAIDYSETAVDPLPLFYDVIEGSDI